MGHLRWRLNLWSGRRDSNPRPSAWEALDGRRHWASCAGKDVNLIEEVEISFEFAVGRRVGRYIIQSSAPKERWRSTDGWRRTS